MHSPDEIGSKQHRGPRRNWTAIPAALLLIVLGLVAYRVLSIPQQAPAAGHLAQAGTRQRPAGPKPTIAQKPSPSATAAAAAPAIVFLTPVSVAAFGPGGVAQGDNPQIAPLAIAGDPATPWHTDWYATAHFGNVQTGTGLLLDMGRPVTVTAAQITLGSTPGADLELLAGNVPTLANLHKVASAVNAGGVLGLQLAGSVSGRFLLIWFTALPPDDSGTYQAFISGVVLKGVA